MNHFKNTDGIIISDDEIIGTFYKNITIQTPIKITHRQKKLQQQIFETATEFYFKISNLISNYYSSPDTLNVDVDQELHAHINQVFALICILVAESGLAESDELKADLQDLEKIYDSHFYDQCHTLLTQFTTHFEILNSNFCHA